MQLQRHGSDQAQCRTARMNRWWCARWRPLSSARFSPGRPRSIPGRQGRGDRSAAPPTGGVTPADRPAPLHPRRPDDPGDTGEAAAPRSLANLPGRSVDSASLAPRADPPTLDVPSQASTRRALDPEVVDLVLRLGTVAFSHPGWPAPQIFRCSPIEPCYAVASEARGHLQAPLYVAIGHAGPVADLISTGNFCGCQS
jgi:hypothetical protein